MTRSLEDGLVGYWPLRDSIDGRLSNESGGRDGLFGHDARWIWFTNPRAVRRVGNRDRTYVGYLGGPTGTDIQVGAYDHGTDSFHRTTVDESFSADDHTNPSVLVDAEGRIHVFWTAHNGDAIYHRRSRRPEDVAEFGPVTSLDQETVTYPNPVQLSGAPDAPLYLFYRDRTITRDATDDEYGYMGDGHLYFRRSTDDETWSEEARLVTAPTGHYGVYFVRAATDDAVHLFCTDAERGGDAPKWDVRHARFTGDGLEAADGTTLATDGEWPVRMDDLELVYDSSAPDGEYAWVWDAAADASGEPAVVYATFPSPDAHRYRYARWDADDGLWRDVHLRDAGGFVEEAGVERHYSAGVALDPDDPTVVYACTSSGNERAVERFETDDGGRTWDSTTIREAPVGTPLRPVVPTNASPDVPVLWLEGEYESMHASQTVLRGLPSPDVADRLRTDGDAGVSLGLDPFPGEQFRNGLSVSALVSTTEPTRRQTILQFGDGIRFDVARDTAGAFEFSLSNGSTTVTTTNDVRADERSVLEGAWDPETERMTLSVDGQIVDERSFGGPIEFDGPNASWTLAKDAYLLGRGLRGELAEVRLYDRPTTAEERRRLVERARNGRV